MKHKRHETPQSTRRTGPKAKAQGHGEVRQPNRTQRHSHPDQHVFCVVQAAKDGLSVAVTFHHGGKSLSCAIMFFLFLRKCDIHLISCVAARFIVPSADEQCMSSFVFFLSFVLRAQLGIKVIDSVFLEYAILLEGSEAWSLEDSCSTGQCLTLCSVISV